MWQTTHELIVKDVTKEQIWSTWSDVNRWHQWDRDIEFTKLSGLFQEGNQFELKPKDGPKVTIHIVKCDPLHGFTDLVHFPLAKMYSIHSMEEMPQSLKVVHTIRVEGLLGWLWRKLVAQKIADGMPEQTELLVKTAKQK